MSNLQPNCCLKFDFQKVDQHAGGKWLIHGTKRRKDNQLQSLKLPCRISNHPVPCCAAICARWWIKTPIYYQTMRQLDVT